MGKIMKIREMVLRLSWMVVFGMSLLILLFVTITSFLYYTEMLSSNFDFTDVRRMDHPVCLLLWIAVCSLAVYTLSSALKRFGSMGNHVLFGIIFVVVMGGCAWWIINSQSVPGSDSKAVYDIAVRAMNHDLLPIAPTGSYMSLWPFQSGLLLFFETILRFIPGADYITIQWCNWIFVALMLVSGYCVVRRWFPKEGTVTFWCIFMMFCLPCYLLVNFLYGDIPGLGLMVFAMWMLTEYMQREKKMCLMLGVAGLGGVSLCAKTI